MGFSPETYAIIAGKGGKANGFATLNENGKVPASQIPSVACRPNLLDNWYFVGGGSQQGGGQFPINQRGLTSYVYNYLGGYTIDRWKCQTGGTTTVTNSGIAINGFSPYGDHGNLVQYPRDSWPGQKATASILINGTELITITATLSNTTVQAYSEDGKTTLALSKAAFAVRHDGGDGDTVTVNAAKLELGDTQTLAHKENGVWVLNEVPDYSLELVKCQRYMYVANQSGQVYGAVGNGNGFSANMVSVFVSLPVQMRALPTVKYTGAWQVSDEIAGGQRLAVTAISATNETFDGTKICLTATASGVTNGKYYLLRASNDASARMIFDANL